MSGTAARKRDNLRRFFRRSRKPSPATPAARPPLQSLFQPASSANSHGQPHSEEQFLSRALERLDPEVQETIRDLNGHDGDITSAIARALDAANNQKSICERKRWRWNIRGHEVLLQDVADKTILWLNRFKTAGDIAVNADPIHAGLLWAGFRIILEVRCCSHPE